MLNYILIIFQEMILVFMILISVAFFSLMERKILSYIHFRKGPNKVMIIGFFQPFADAIKLLSKDDFPVMWSNKLLYYISPNFMFLLSLLSWMVFPFFWGGVSYKYSFIMIIMIMGSSIYGVMLSGWSSNSVYSMLGSMRSISQSISYEVVMSFIFLSIINLVYDFSIEGLHKWELMKIFFLCPFLTVIMMISLLAEMNRSPFDLAEGESELVSGYSVEYGGISYTVIFLSENMMIFFSSFLITFFFFSSLSNYISYIIFSFFTLIICVIRGVTPRVRYDKLMTMCWIWLMPITLLLFNLIIMMNSSFSFMTSFLVDYV